MSGTQPVAVYALKVPPGEVLVPAVPKSGAMFRVSMAAIDPNEEPEYENADSSKPARATLKLVRSVDFDDSDDEDYEVESDEDSDDEEVNGGPSDKEKAKKLKEAAARKEMEDAMDEDSDSGDGDVDMKTAISKLIKGKGRATGDEDDEESDESLELEEVVVCTLDPEKQWQQPLDITVSEDERVFFKVTGTHTIYLTGNYVIPADEGRQFDEDEDDEDDDEDEYDLSPDEDEIEFIDEGEESDELDGLENPRITEIHSDEEEEAPKLVQAKGKNKRAAEDSDEKPNGDANLSKKQQKKLKKNNGEAAPVEKKDTEHKKETEQKKETKESPASTSKSDKKVQFAKNLEQGPTPSSQDKKPAEKPAEKKTTGTLGVKEVKGVKIDDKKLGTGPAAKEGNTVSLRYIGKLEDGKVFDANKKGKPFTFKLGKGEVIKGWDIGIAGMAAGGERRITIPPHLGYGKKAMPGIPPNSKLIFDVKLLEIK